MDLTEGLIVACVEALGKGTKLPYGEHAIDFTPPWQRRTYAELFQEHVGVAMDDQAGVAARALAEGFPTAGKHHDVLVHHLFEDPRRGQAARPGLRVRLPGRTVPADQAQAGATRTLPSASSCTCTAWSWPTPTPS